MTRKDEERREFVSRSGLLVVVTGTSGAGKDSVVSKLRTSSELAHLNLGQVVTTASRGKRDGETHGVDYYFSSIEVMQEMERNGEFVEPLTPTGSSYKATEKKEILPVLQEGKSTIWRIDLSRAAEIAAGGYFHKFFDKETADRLESNTVVVLVDIDPDLSYEDLMKLREQRDGSKFNRDDYEERDRQESKILSEHGHHFKHKVVNKWGQLDSTAKEVTSLLINFVNSK